MCASQPLHLGQRLQRRKYSDRLSRDRSSWKNEKWKHGLRNTLFSEASTSPTNSGAPRAVRRNRRLHAALGGGRLSLPLRTTWDAVAVKVSGSYSPFSLNGGGGGAGGGSRGGPAAHDVKGSEGTPDRRSQLCRNSKTVGVAALNEESSDAVLERASLDVVTSKWSGALRYSLNP